MQRWQFPIHNGTIESLDWSTSMFIISETDIFNIISPYKSDMRISTARKLIKEISKL